LFFAAEHLLSVDLERFLGASAPGASPLDLATCRLLREYLATRTPAVAVFALAGEATWSDLSAVDIGDVAADGTSATVGGDVLHFPAFAQGLVRVHRAERVADGGRDHDPFFAREDGGRLAPHRFGHDARKLAAHVGVRVGERAARQGASEAENRWARRLGIVVRPLAEASNGPPRPGPGLRAA
jgi:hypothetical protein